MKRKVCLILALLLLLSGCEGGEGFGITGQTQESTAATRPSGTQPSVTEPTQSHSQPTQPPTEPTQPPTKPPTEPAVPPTEPTEPAPADPPETDLEDSDFVRVIDYIPTIRQALAYATEDNFTGQVIYDFLDAYLRWGTVKKLALVCRDLAEQGLGLLIWDGYRPVWAQQKLWDVCPDPTYVSPPGTGTQSHCRGIALDVALVELESGALLEMPSGFDEFSTQGDRDYSDCSMEAARNARLLEDVMEKYGFQPYFGEWWHFSDRDTYPIEEIFDPAAPVIWAAECNEYINLRKTAGGSEILDHIPKGECFQLLQWEGKYAKICYRGMVGYVMASYMIPADQGALGSGTVPVTNCYSYERLLADLQTLALQYPGLVRTESIGTSELGRQIPVIRIGPEDAAHHVLLQGAMHGREHAAAWLLMALADYWLAQGMEEYGDFCFHIIPMANPDGVVISQTGVLNDGQMAIYERDLRLGYTSSNVKEYAARWKANGLGVDLNRNFPAGWETIDDRTGPSSQLYAGEEPFSAAEARALRDYTLRYDFDTTVSYHATGSLTYYEYGSNGPVNQLGMELAKKWQAVSGYAPIRSSGVDGAGFKDWAIEALQIPSLTVEIGCQDTPLHMRELYSIFFRNYRLLHVVADWVREM